MCGIAGIVRFDAPASASAERLTVMRRKLRHRGPDGEGTYFGRRAALAHTRLAVIDLAGGAQPMTTPDGRYTIVYNGEVYNFRELRGALDYPFRTNSDAEVVLAAFATWGEACLSKLNGMFAFFVWDEKEERGFAARDRLGIKPFVYRAGSDGFHFASEAKAIVGEHPQAHDPSVIEYLIAPYFSGVEHSMFEGIEPLPAGSWLSVDGDGVRTHRWWSYEVCDSDRSVDDLRELLKRAVRRAMISDVPVASYLSGGIDSTILTALARPQRAFTIRFEGQDRYDYGRSTIVTSDDTEYARLAAVELRVPLHFVSVDRAELLRELPRICAIDDAIPAWEQEFAQYFLAREASRHVKVVLVGDAADEMHYGYHFLVDKTPREILRLFGGERRAALLRDGARDALERYDGYSTPSLIVKRWLARLLHNGDIQSMAWGLEARVPFGDTELIEWARGVPLRRGFRDGIEKSMLREAAEGWIPDAIRRRKKSALPKDQEVGREYQREAERVLEDHASFLKRYVDLKLVRPLYHGPLDEMDRALLFNLLCLVHWSDHYGVRPS